MIVCVYVLLCVCVCVCVGCDEYVVELWYELCCVRDSACVLRIVFLSYV
jgi:hypothetical protein